MQFDQSKQNKEHKSHTHKSVLMQIDLRPPVRTSRFAHNLFSPLNSMFLFHFIVPLVFSAHDSLALLSSSGPFFSFPFNTSTSPFHVCFFRYIPLDATSLFQNAIKIPCTHRDNPNQHYAVPTTRVCVLAFVSCAATAEKCYASYTTG